MTGDEALLSRRALLAAAAAGLATAGVAVASGCTHRAATPPADPDAAAIEAARRAERLLLATYAEGSPQHSVHLAHLRALGDRLAPPSPTPLPSAPGTGPEAATVPALTDAARNARRGSTAALLASIAASHAVLGGAR